MSGSGRAMKAVVNVIEILDDERYRQILLGLLVRIAARKGNVDAASGWLAYLNPCSMDLEMDTAYRYAAATIFAATSDTTKIGELLGFKAGDIPLSHRDKTACRLLQIHAVELNGDIEKAGRALWSEINEQGEKTIKQKLARHLPLAVCPQSIAWVEAQQKQQAADKAADEIESAREVYRDRIERFQQKIELHKGARYKTYGLAALIVTAALLIANIFWTAVMLDSGHDPWFGAASPFICARVCDGCTPPIVLRGNGTFCVAPVDPSIAFPYTEESQVLFLLVVLVVMFPGYTVILSIVLFKVRSFRRATRNRLQATLRGTEQKLSALDIKT